MGWIAFLLHRFAHGLETLKRKFVQKICEEKAFTLQILKRNLYKKNPAVAIPLTGLKIGDQIACFTH